MEEILEGRPLKMKILEDGSPLVTLRENKVNMEEVKYRNSFTRIYQDMLKALRFLENLENELGVHKIKVEKKVSNGLLSSLSIKFLNPL